MMSDTHSQWDPKPDITTFELAVCLPYATRMIRLTLEEAETWKHGAARHFRWLCAGDDASAKARIARLLERASA